MKPTFFHRFGALLALALLLIPRASAQQPGAHVFRFFDPSGAVQVEAEVLWGNIQVVAHDSDEIRLRVRHTAENGQPRFVENVADYVQVASQNTRYRISGRTPPNGGFESIDLLLMVPARADLAVRIGRGGEIDVRGMDGLVNVSHKNGSVVLRDLTGGALVNAVNGSIRASFAEAPDEAMSFMTLNGEVDLVFPADLRAHVDLRSERNGHIDSDFLLPGVSYPYAAEARHDSEEKPDLSPRPISLRAAVNGGGPTLVAASENGPVRLRKR